MSKWPAALGLTGIGFVIAGSIILGVLVGHWLDSKLNSDPVGLIIGVIVGILVASYSVYTMIRPFLSNNGKKGNS
ncbi:AtpZ/AtpI family protein [Chloroflexota bacterium]